MKKSLLVISLGARRESAVTVQKLLTSFGCMIKTRIGIHDGVLDRCSDFGLIVVELVGEHAQHRQLAGKLKAVRQVRCKLIPLPLR